MVPPDLPGFRYERLLGSGGYSDVFLYEQEMPRRQVAIKVLVSDSLDGVDRQQFGDEANAMAAVSTHPFIVTIFHADIGPDGHPFLVMEYYPRPNFSVRARREQLSVAEVLRTGVQVASAVETAHRAGILHRDIKPANILTSEYGRPGLTDFGISSALVDGQVQAADGLSIPWAPPEVINGTAHGDRTSDVYSLAATIYTLLTGRSPFEVVGGSNRSLDLVERIERHPVPPTGRRDVPRSLERLLRQGMSKEPADRPGSAAAFARALQEIELEQQLAATPLEVRDEGSGASVRQDVDDEDATHLKGPVVIRSQPPPSTERRGAPVGREGGVSEGTVLRSNVTPDGLITGIAVDPIVSRVPPAHPPAAEGSPSAAAPSASSSQDLELPEQVAPAEQPAEATAGGRRLVRAAWVVVAVVAALVGTRLLVGTDGSADHAAPRPTTVTTRVRPRVPPAPRDVAAVPLGGERVRITWSPPEDEEVDGFAVIGPGDETLEQVDAGVHEVVLDAAPACVHVVGVRAGRTSRLGECVATAG